MFTPGPDRGLHPVQARGRGRRDPAAPAPVGVRALPRLLSRSSGVSSCRSPAAITSSKLEPAAVRERGRRTSTAPMRGTAPAVPGTRARASPGAGRNQSPPSAGTRRPRPGLPRRSPCAPTAGCGWGALILDYVPGANQPSALSDPSRRSYFLQPQGRRALPSLRSRRCRDSPVYACVATPSKLTPDIGRPSEVLVRLGGRAEPPVSSENLSCRGQSSNSAGFARAAQPLSQAKGDRSGCAGVHRRRGAVYAS